MVCNSKPGIRHNMKKAKTLKSLISCASLGWSTLAADVLEKFAAKTRAHPKNVEREVYDSVLSSQKCQIYFDGV